MAIVSLTNQIAVQSLRGQGCKITVDLSTQSNEFKQLKVGQLADSIGGKCYVYSIDTYGNSFEIIPVQPDFYAGREGYITSATDIDVTIS